MFSKPGHAHGSPAEQGTAAPGPGCGSLAIIYRLVCGGNVASKMTAAIERHRRDEEGATSGYCFQNKRRSNKGKMNVMFTLKLKLPLLKQT